MLFRAARPQVAWGSLKDLMFGSTIMSATHQTQASPNPVSDPAPLRRTHPIMRNGGYITDRRDLEADSLKSTKRRFTP